MALKGLDQVVNVLKMVKQESCCFIVNMFWHCALWQSFVGPAYTRVNLCQTKE